MKLKKLAENYLSEIFSLRKISDNTLIAYRKDLDQFLEFCRLSEIENIENISERIIKRFLMELSELGIGARSIGRKLSVLRGFFKYTVTNKYIEDNPVKRIANPKTEKKLPEILALDSFLEIVKLLSKYEDSEKAKLFKTIFELLYGCALRVSELCSLNYGDIDLDSQTIRVLGKGSKMRIVPVGNISKEIIQEYINSRDNIVPDDPLLITPTGIRLYPRYVQRVVKKYISKVSDISKKSPHVLRHSAATHMLDRGADLLAVKEILGHENLSTTQIYTHVSIDRLKKTYKSSHPKS